MLFQRPIVPKQQSLFDTFRIKRNETAHVAAVQVQQTPPDNKPQMVIPECNSVSQAIDQCVKGVPSRNIPPLNTWSSMFRSQSGYYHRTAIYKCLERYKRVGKEEQFWIKYKDMPFGVAGRKACPRDKNP